MLVAGVDLSGRTTGVTALAWLDGTRLEYVEADRALRRDADLADRIRARRPDLVAIDAPLTLPHAVVCNDDACVVCFAPDGGAPLPGSRTLDRAPAWLAAGHPEKPPMPSAMLAAIAYRAIYVARRLRGIETIETWPMGVYRALARAAGDTTTDTGDAWRHRLLARVVAGIDGVEGTDRLDAVAAAYAAWCKLTGRAVAVTGDLDEGAIWVPAVTKVPSSPAPP